MVFTALIATSFQNCGGYASSAVKTGVTGSSNQSSMNFASIASVGGEKFCANENEFCGFEGSATVRYGANGVYVSKVVENGTACTNDVFGDPIYGVAKSCLVGDITYPVGIPRPQGPIFSSNAVVRFRSQVNAQCLDIPGASLAPGAPLTQYPCNGTGAQAFQLLRFPDGDYALRNVISGLCVDVPGASQALSAELRQYPCNFSPAQKFRFVFTGYLRQVHILNINSWMALTVPGHFTEGATIVQYTPEFDTFDWSAFVIEAL